MELPLEGVFVLETGAEPLEPLLDPLALYPLPRPLGVTNGCWPEKQCEIIYRLYTYRHRSRLEHEAETRTVVLCPHLHWEIVDIEAYGRWIASPPTSAKTTTSAAKLGTTTVVASSGLSLDHCPLYQQQLGDCEAALKLD